MIFYLLGILCILYFAGVVLFAGLASKFPLVWLAAGIGLLFLGILIRSGRLEWALLPKTARMVITAVLIVGFLCFFIIEGMILSGFREKQVDNLDYIIVLGAQLKENGPSRILRMRLEKAYEYLVKNENTKVIVSGGQGSAEPMSEAEGMYRYLCEKGIAPERILLEAESKNTHQNLRNSKLLIKEKDALVGIVSSNFHIFRAGRLAKKAGYENIYGIPANSEPFLQPNNMAREFCGIMKDFLVGNL